MNKLLVLLLLASTTTLAKGNAIDTQLDKCKNDPSIPDMGIADCYQKAAKSWDAMLNDEYKQLMSDTELTKEFKDSLKKSQLAWIKYKELYTNSIKKFYGNEQGSIWSIVYIENVMLITKDKALELHKLRLSTDLSASPED